MSTTQTDRPKAAKKAEKATKKATPAAAKEPKAKVDKSRPCGCGCGGTTKGGRFLPGHDAIHKGNLIRSIKTGTAVERRKALVEAEKQGWDFSNHVPADSAA